MWYEAGTKKTNASGKSIPFWSEIPVNELDINVDPGLFDEGEPGFEQRITALLNNCTEGFNTWLEQYRKEKNRKTAAEYLKS